jgi:hypothetical protein
VEELVDHAVVAVAVVVAEEAAAVVVFEVDAAEALVEEVAIRTI